MFDLTEVVHDDLEVQVASALTGVMEHRAAIEQAKGMLMMAFGLSPDEAFDVLRSRSQSTNTKVNELAERMTTSGITSWRTTADRGG
jgi:AmiR/NasT family two-component response regulator